MRFCELPGDARKGLGCWDEVGALLAPEDAERDDAKQAAGARFTDLIRAQAARYYGTAYPAWLRYVADNREAMTGEFEKMLPLFESTYLSDSAGGQARRVLVRFAAFAFAGEKAIAAGILPLEPGDAAQAVARIFREWVAAFGGESNQEPRRMVEQVREWLQRYAHTRLGDMRRSWVEDTHTARPADCGGWKRPTKETAAQDKEHHVFEYLIYPAIFKAELCKGFNPEQVIQELVKRGLLECPPVGKDGKRRTSVTAREPGAGKPSRFYLVTPRILEGDDDAAA